MQHSVMLLFDTINKSDYYINNNASVHLQLGNLHHAINAAISIVFSYITT